MAESGAIDQTLEDRMTEALKSSAVLAEAESVSATVQLVLGSIEFRLAVPEHWRPARGSNAWELSVRYWSWVEGCSDHHLLRWAHSAEG